MLKLKKIILSLNILAILFLLSGCSDKDSANTIKVGAVDGPDVKLVEIARVEALKRFGLKVKIVPFSDYNIPNVALQDGSIEANVFQHLPFLEAQNKARHFNLVPIAKTFVFPVGIYSYKITQLAQLPENAKVAIPNDPSNEARALLLLERANLIKLKPGVGMNATRFDVAVNPKKINFVELDACQLPRSLRDVDIAIINNNYAVPAGLIPTRDAIFLEAKDSHYANIIAVRAADKNNPKILKFVAAFHSKAVIDEAQKMFAGGAYPVWASEDKSQRTEE